MVPLGLVLCGLPAHLDVHIRRLVLEGTERANRLGVIRHAEVGSGR